MSLAPLRSSLARVLEPEAIWFLGDGKYRSKIGVPQQRVKPVAGSIDMQQGVLTLTLPKAEKVKPRKITVA